MVAINQMAQLIGLKRQRESAEQRAKSGGFRDMGQAMQIIAQGLKEKKLQEEEQRRWDEEMGLKKSDLTYKRTMDATNAQEKNKREIMQRRQAELEALTA